MKVQTFLLAVVAGATMGAFNLVSDGIFRVNGGEPIPKGELDYGRAMGQGVTIYTAIGAANADVYPTHTSGGSTQGVYAYGSVNLIKLEGGEGTCCWTSYDDATLGAQAAATATQITAGGATGDCVGHQFSDGESHDMVCELENMRGRTGFTGRYCTGYVRDHHGAMVKPPCSETADCTPYGAGTCAAAGSGDDNGSCKLVCSLSAAGSIKEGGER